MRKWIDAISEAKDFQHPHLVGKPEWFRYLWGTFLFNIDKARQMIASGEVKAERHTIAVKDAYAILGLDASEYGSQHFGDDKTSFNMMSGIQSRETMKGMPEDKLNEPAIIVMWNVADGMKRAGLPLDKQGRAEQSKPHPVLIDGNHRLGRLFLEGAEKADVFVIPYEEALKFCYDRYQQPIKR